VYSSGVTPAAATRTSTLSFACRGLGNSTWRSPPKPEKVFVSIARIGILR
jgi:hypothetical protein